MYYFVGERDQPITTMGANTKEFSQAKDKHNNKLDGMHLPGWKIKGRERERWRKKRKSYVAKPGRQQSGRQRYIHRSNTWNAIKVNTLNYGLRPTDNFPINF